MYNGYGKSLLVEVNNKREENKWRIGGTSKPVLIDFTTAAEEKRFISRN